MRANRIGTLADHVSVTSTWTRVWVLAVSVPAGPVIGIGTFVVIATFVSAIWPLGLVAILVAPAFCCYQLGRRLGGRELGTAAAIVAAISSLVAAVALLIYAFSQLELPVVV